MLQIAHVVAHDPRQPVALPDPVLAVVLREERLRKPAEAQQRLEIVPRRHRAQLAQRVRVQAEVPIPVRERVAALAVVVEAGRARDHDPPARALRVVEAFHQVPPARVLVDFVEDEQRLAGGELEPAEPGGIAGIVPGEVGRVALVGVGVYQGQRERRLPDLPGPADEGHLARERRCDERREVPGPTFHHIGLYSTLLVSKVDFVPLRSGRRAAPRGTEAIVRLGIGTCGPTISPAMMEPSTIGCFRRWKRTVVRAVTPRTTMSEARKAWGSCIGAAPCRRTRRPTEEQP